MYRFIWSKLSEKILEMKYINFAVAASSQSAFQVSQNSVMLEHELMTRSEINFLPG